jgi:hypothetical protein
MKKMMITRNRVVRPSIQGTFLDAFGFMEDSFSVGFPPLWLSLQAKIAVHPATRCQLPLPVSWRDTLFQYAGRLHCLHDMKKEVVIYDYSGPDIPMLVKMHKRRLAGYVAIGYEIKE